MSSKRKASDLASTGDKKHRQVKAAGAPPKKTPKTTEAKKREPAAQKKKKQQRPTPSVSSTVASAAAGEFKRVLETALEKMVRMGEERIDDWGKFVYADCGLYARRVFSQRVAAVPSGREGGGSSGGSGAIGRGREGKGQGAAAAEPLQLDDAALAATLTALDGPLPLTQQPTMQLENGRIETRMVPPKRLPTRGDLAFLLCRTPGDPELARVYDKVAAAAEAASSVARVAYPLPPHHTAAQRACAAAALWALAGTQDKGLAAAYPRVARDWTAAVATLLAAHGVARGRAEALLVGRWMEAWVVALPAARAFVWGNRWFEAGLTQLSQHLEKTRQEEAHARALATSAHLVLPVRLVFESWRVALDLPYAVGELSAPHVPPRCASSTDVCAAVASAYAGGDTATSYRWLKLDPTPTSATQQRLAALAAALRAVAARAPTAADKAHRDLCGMHASARPAPSDDAGHEELEAAATALVVADAALPIGPRGGERATATARALALLALGGGVPPSALLAVAADLEMWGPSLNPYRQVDFDHRGWRATGNTSIEEFMRQLRAAPRPAQQPWLALHAVVAGADAGRCLEAVALLLVVDYAAAAWDTGALSDCVRLRPW